MFSKLVYFGSKICIVSIKYVSKRFIIYKAVKTNSFYIHPLTLRLYTGCRLDETFSKSGAGFQKVKEQSIMGISALHFLNFAVFLLRMRTL